MIPEANRIAYLEALGITQYVAHTAIDGALQLPVLEWEAVAADVEEISDAVVDAQVYETDAHGSEQQSIAEKSEVAVVAKSESAGGSGSENITAKAPVQAHLTDQSIPELDLARLGFGATKEKPPQALKAVSSVRAFSCVLVTMPGQFRVLLELAGADAPGLSAAEHRMLSDLLGALGTTNALDQFPPKLYRWPVINNPRMAADPVAALDALSAFLATTESVSKTLVIGAKAGVALGLAQGGIAQALDNLPGQFGLVPGFAEMASDWKLKAEAWSRISEFLS